MSIDISLDGVGGGGLSETGGRATEGEQSTKSRVN